MRRCRRTAPKPRLFHFCGMAGWETICERGSSLGFSQNTVFASPPNVRATSNFGQGWFAIANILAARQAYRMTNLPTSSR